jgi:hypothetical protein
MKTQAKNRTDQAKNRINRAKNAETQNFQIVHCFFKVQNPEFQCFSLNSNHA